MKLIIELDDKDYELAKADKVSCGYQCRHIMVAVKNGTPYNPSGDAISRSALKTELEVYRHTRNYKSDEEEAQNALLNNILEDIDNVPTVPQVTVFTENADEKAVADLKAELQNIIEARPQGDCISRSDLKKKFDKECQNDCSVCEHSRFDSFKGYYHCGLIDNAQAIPLPNEQIISDIPKDYLYDTETKEFYVYRNKYTGKEIHIVKNPPAYILDKRPQGEQISWEQGFEAGLAQGKHSRQKGEWEIITIPHGLNKYKCNQCQHYLFSGMDRNFCPNCGADMRPKGGAE